MGWLACLDIAGKAGNRPQLAPIIPQLEIHLAPLSCITMNISDLINIYVPTIHRG